MLTRKDKGIYIFRTRAFERARTLQKSRPRRHNIVEKQDMPSRDLRAIRAYKCPAQLTAAFFARELIKRCSFTAAYEQRFECDPVRL